jgi:hypothetical protein
MFIFTQQQEEGSANITWTGGYKNDTFRAKGHHGPSDGLSLRNISARFCSLGMRGCKDLWGDKPSSLFTQSGCYSKSIHSLVIWSMDWAQFQFTHLCPVLGSDWLAGLL